MKKLTKSLEKYLYVIFKLLKNKEKTTPKTVGEIVGFNKASTLESIKILQNKGYLEYYPHKEIVLTDEGKKYAKEIEERKKLVRKFLQKFLLVEDENLESSVESVEYFLDDYLLERFALFLDFLGFCPYSGPKWIDGFKNYLQNGEMPEDCAKCMENSEESGILGENKKCLL